MRVPVQMNLSSSEAFSAYQIEITEGNCEEALETSLPKVIPLAGIEIDNEAAINNPRATNFNLT